LKVAVAGKPLEFDIPDMRWRRPDARVAVSRKAGWHTAR